MTTTQYLRRAAVAVLVVTAPSLAYAQEPQVRTAAAAAAAVRTDLVRNARPTRYMLLQVDAQYSPAELDRVVAALEEVATTSPDPEAVRLAVDILTDAATDTAHTPYAPAGEALLRIAKTTNHSGAAWKLARLPNRKRALQYLRSVAVEAPPSEQSAAVFKLTNEMGPEGVEVLHELYLQGLVKGGEAECALQLLAENEGWPDRTPDPTYKTTKDGRPHVIVRHPCY